MVSRFFQILLATSAFSYIFSRSVSIVDETDEEFYGDENFTHVQIWVRQNPISLHSEWLGMGVGKDFQSNITLNHYMSPLELKHLLDKLAAEYEDIVKVSELGFSAVDHTPIYAVQISRNVQEDREMLKPMFKFVANIDGDDAVGYFLMTTMMQYLVYSYGYNDRVTRLLNTTDIWIVPTMNPDGLSRSKEGCDQTHSEGKCNGEGVDLDKDFPHKPNDNTTLQPETRHMLEFITSNPFVLSGNLQGGAIVASYFLEDNVEGTSDDRDVFEKLAKTYAGKNEKMATGTACNQSFPGGISDGTKLGKKAGSMQYANFVLSNCFDLTLHLSCCKHPPASELATNWDDNVDALFALMDSARRGIYGMVKDTDGNPIKGAVITVHGRTKEVKGTDRGEYWRLLKPGHYKVTASAPGAIEQTQHLVRIPERPPYALQLDFTFTRQGVHGNVTNEDNERVEATINVATIFGLHVAAAKTKNGEYWLCVPNGMRVSVSAAAQGYKTERKSVTVNKEHSYVKVDFGLINT